MKRLLLSFCVIVCLFVGIIWYAFYSVPLTTQELAVLAIDYLDAFNSVSDFETDVYLFDFEKESIDVVNFNDFFKTDIVEWSNVLYFTNNYSIDIANLEELENIDSYNRTEKIDGVLYVSSEVLNSFPTYVIDSSYGLLYCIEGMRDNPLGNVKLGVGQMSEVQNKYVFPFTSTDNTLIGSVEIYLNSFGRVVNIEILY